MKKKVFIIDGDRWYGECLCVQLGEGFVGRQFSNAYEVMGGLEEELPDLIFSEVNLPGVNVFVLLQELISYPDTARIPVILITDVKFPEGSLKDYNIKAILKKETTRPEEIRRYARRYTN